MRSPDLCTHCLGLPLEILKVTEKYVIVCSLVIYSAPNWPTRATFRAIYTVMNYRTVVGSHQPLVLSSVLCKQTWLPEKHSVHISCSPTLKIRLNKNAWSFPPFCLWWQEGVRHSPGRLLLRQNGFLYLCVCDPTFIFGLGSMCHANGNGGDRRKAFRAPFEQYR